MGVSSWRVLEQGPVLGALGRTALSALAQRLPKPRGEAGAPATPGPEIRRTVRPPSRALIDDYVRHLGGEPRAYRGTLPPHLFPQWAFPLAARTLEGLPYPLLRVVNGGCRMEIRQPLPSGEPLTVRARLESIDDDGRRVVLQQRVVTGTASRPDALHTDFYAIAPLASGPKAGAQRERPRVPDGAREVARWRLPADAGLCFAKLTGDFNPIHWLPLYARAAGFPNVILHGFGTLARACEGLIRNLFAGDVHALRMIDVRFTRPLVLPAQVGLFVAGAEVFAGDAAMGPAYMVGRFETGEER